LRDGFVCIGTLVIVAEIGFIVLLAFRGVAAVVPSTSELGRTLGIEEKGPAVAVGQQAWIKFVTTDLNPTPKYSLQNQRLPAFQPIIITGITPDRQWVSVLATRLNGQRQSGWVLTDRVQTVSPTLHAVPEKGWLVVTGARGAALRGMPDVNADSWGYAPKGQKLKKLGRLKRGSFNSDEHDYLFVENLGPGGHKGNAWVFEPEVEATSGPAF